MRERRENLKREIFSTRPFGIVDMLLVLGVVALSIFLIVNVASGKDGVAYTLVVEANGREVMRVPLTQESHWYEVEGYQGKSVFLVENYEVMMVDSACPDKLCVRVGRVRAGGASIVCLPNRVVLRLEGNGFGPDVFQR